MTPLTLAKSQIKLEQIDVNREASIRQLLGSLTLPEREALIEIVEGPTSFPKSSISLSQKQMERLSSLGLLRVEGPLCQVDKEMRRRVECELERMDDAFRPDIASFTQFLKRTVALHHLPLWYLIPRSSETIEKALIEKFFETPELYERYLTDLSLESGFVGEMAKEALLNRTLKVAEIQKRFKLSGDELEKALLLAEYQMVLFHGYDAKGRIMRPLLERSDYLREVSSRQPKKLDEKRIEKRDREPFAFIQTLPDFQKELSYEEQALKFYRHPKNQLTKQQAFGEIASHLAIRVIENSLRYTKEYGWVLFEEFLASVRVPAPLFDTVRLIQRGKRYAYAFPEYDALQKELIHDVIFERLYRAGMVEVGSCGGKECFKLTEFGAQLLA